MGLFRYIRERLRKKDRDKEFEEWFNSLSPEIRNAAGGATTLLAKMSRMPGISLK